MDDSAAFFPLSSAEHSYSFPSKKKHTVLWDFFFFFFFFFFLGPFLSFFSFPLPLRPNTLQVSVSHQLIFTSPTFFFLFFPPPPRLYISFFSLWPASIPIPSFSYCATKGLQRQSEAFKANPSSVPIPRPTVRHRTIMAPAVSAWW